MMVKVQNFSEGLEGSLTRLGTEVSKKIESPEFKEAPIEQVIKESLKSLPVQSVPPPGEGRKPVESGVTAGFLPSYLADADAEDDEVKAVVENLVALAFESGVEQAVAEARRYPPFVEDAFHDALTEKLVPELRKRGIIK